jgi:integral membrane protein (TIGR01906 family)
MDDVKKLVQTGLSVYSILSILFLAAFLHLMFAKAEGKLRRGIRAGGWLLIGLMVAILVSVALDFSAFFTWFHTLFFQGDSWIFYYSDTFIRLFPLRFWSDAFIYVGSLSLVVALLAIGQPKLTKKARQ